MPAAPLEGLNVKLAFPGATRHADALTNTLAALESEPLLAPTKAGRDERKPEPYARQDALALVATDQVAVLALARASAPKYKGALTTYDASHNLFYAEYGRSGLTAKHVSALYAAASRLAEQLRPEIGFVHSVYRSADDAQAYNSGLNLRLKELHKFGLPVFYARTWLGPDMVAAYGEAMLLALPHATRTSWGGVQVDLSDAPWEASYETLRAGQLAIQETLSARGLLGDFESAPIHWSAGKQWRPPAWNLGPGPR